MKKIKLNITGMHCASCKKAIEMELSGKVNKVDIKEDGESIIEFNENNISEKEIEGAIKRAGYGIKK